MDNKEIDKNKELVNGVNLEKEHKRHILVVSLALAAATILTVVLLIIIFW